MHVAGKRYMRKDGGVDREKAMRKMWKLYGILAAVSYSAGKAAEPNYNVAAIFYIGLFVCLGFFFWSVWPMRKRYPKE